MSQMQTDKFFIFSFISIARGSTKLLNAVLCVVLCVMCQ